MLRDYQQDMYDKAQHALRTHDGVCCVLPCRSGKTYIIKAIVDSASKKGNKVLILAHRNLLLNQHRKLIKNCRIASVFTEVNHLGEHGMPDLIIIDEAHISGAESYQKVCEFYKCKRVLFTATAKRLDNKPLSLADVIINGISADELIKRGCVSDYDLYAPKLNINLNVVAMSGSDFNQEQLGNIMMDHKIYGDILLNYNKYAKGKQAIAYCTNIKHSQTMCELFNKNGIPAIHLDSNTKEIDRLQYMADFSKGKYQIICCCNIISEGITLPECDCVLLLRPTQSESLYIQQACRCLTPRPGKKAVIIDFVGNCFAHGMPTEQRIYTLEKAQKIQNASREPDIITRQCNNCYKVYAGNGRICPYCEFDNGKTKKEIEVEERAELERIEAIERKHKRQEVGMAKTKAELVKIAKERGYKYSWVYKQMQLKGIKK